MILHTGSGVYFGMDDVAQSIWQAIQKPVLVSDLLEFLVDEYDAPRERVRDDLLAFLAKLESAGLVDVETTDSDS